MVRLTLIVMLTALQLAFGIPGFLTDGGYWERAVLYSFFHANCWHLAVNAIAIWSVYNPKRKSLLLASYLIAVAVYPLSFKPVIGFSNVLYATLGLRTPPLRDRWWKQPAVIVFLAVTVAMVFIPRFSATTHIAAFLLGIAGAYANRGYLKFSEDARRYY